MGTYEKARLGFDGFLISEDKSTAYSKVDPSLCLRNQAVWIEWLFR